MNYSIIEDWKREGIVLNGPVNIDEMADCERFLDFNFPRDFKQFYLLCSGFAEAVMDSKMLTLWPIIKIQWENWDQAFISVADYNVGSTNIGYIKGKEGIYRDYDEKKICDSFDEFLEHWQKETFVYI
ncbi:SMI1/KNR4 family protein [Desertivirga arenae]|uniref:SMI1/KNR4 family protein n=1 Tax=Desertivirga arenae TaxID=2810309 RepID=UPI001A96ADCC|nr:SMI1/KNR4 family protein [Pedobacter sp. SYSU D00823]